jgi:thymidine kinase
MGRMLVKAQRAGNRVVVSQNALPTLLTTLGYMFARETFCMRLMCHFATEISTLSHACILCMCCACVVQFASTGDRTTAVASSWPLAYF